MTSVLVVEDDDILREVYATKLSLEGFAVDTAADGQEGLEKARLAPPNILLVDMVMPRLTGLELLEKYGLDQRPQVTALAISNQADQPTIQRAKELGVREYLVKAHCTPAEIVERIRFHLSA